MQQHIELKKDDNYRRYKNDLANASRYKLRKVIQNNIAYNNHHPPFTKEWEWEQCCCHHVE